VDKGYQQNYLWSSRNPSEKCLKVEFIFPKEDKVKEEEMVVEQEQEEINKKAVVMLAWESAVGTKC